MTTRTKSMRRSPVESDEPGGFRIKPNGEVEVISAAEAYALVVRALREAMVNAGFRIKSCDRTLH
jgi:hypothetical protein